ncbi:NAD(P)H-dependent flavin oxidoreductase [Brevundimonas sp. NPDC090276]|uniref:NAD(P)H-dependent flavin oxidoreductase n=1 Tax=Brevundimonas sp. NPDC090276 TaxID=3363956 RepID=UPI00383ACB9E
MKTALTDRLGLDLPIIQAPMAGTSTPELAAAVSNAGALGSISIASVDAVEGQRQIQALKALTTRPFNINVFCHAPTPLDPKRDRGWIDSLRPIFTEFDAAPPETLNEIYQSFLTDDAKLAVLLDEKPAVVSFHFGLPQPDKIAALKAVDCVLIASATTPEEGRLAQAAGIDMVVAQGVEAGGHRGVFDPANDPRFATLPLTRLLARELYIPVIAAGGIMDGSGIVAALALGAAGAQLGTAFVSCPESAANPAYRAALAGPRAERTRVSPVISGRPARGIENAFMRRADEAIVAGYPYAYDIGKALNAAASTHGDDGYAPQWAGQAAPLSRALPAAELVEVLAKETRATIRDVQRIS